ncbi:MAG: AAA domain-containing protein [Eubacterium sp.]|nr:AAA domain-containing protein [Eubacterium sp.]MCM1439931.1 AAA domain-containing protein [Roseburia sp.]
MYLEDSDEEDKFWGLFSLEGGKSQNMKNIIDSIKHIHSCLDDDEFEDDPDAYDAFSEQCRNVAEMKNKAQNYAMLLEKRRQYQKKEGAIESECDRLKSEAVAKIEKCMHTAKAYEEKANDAKKLLESIAKKKAELQDHIQQIDTHLETVKAQKPGWFAGKRKKNEYQRLLNETEQSKLSVAKELNLCSENERKGKEILKRLQNDYASCHNQVQNIQKELKARLASEADGLNELKKEISKLEKRTAGVEAKPLDTSLAYEALQLANPWFGEDYRKAQSRLFIAALRVKKQFLYENRKNLKAAINIWDHQKDYQSNKGLLMGAMWGWFNFAIPVISSTFASFSSMCKDLPNESLGHIFIDEAGQATPQSAVGVMLLGKRVMAVGDPSQIKPIFTLDSNILSMLAERYRIDRNLLSDSASVQTLMDQASKFGFYYDKDKSDDSWIGIPLWVHRRCKSPMFDISNEISYHNMMVQGKNELGKAKWLDVSGKADTKYVKEQGDLLYEKIKNLKDENPKIVDHNEKNIVYVISPFVNVVNHLERKLADEEIGFTRWGNNGKSTNIGTIHTFQGKEASIVFLVLGADSDSKSSAAWAVSEPNMMNVAVTRAKDEFYIIGDKSLYKSLGSKTIDGTIKILDQYEE